MNRSDLGKQETSQLQFLRMMAILIIFRYHSVIYQFDPFPFNFGIWWNATSSAVVFFFMLSGLVSGYYSYERDIEMSVKDSLKYVWKKLCKVYPLYLAVTLYSISFYDIPKLIASKSWDQLRYLMLLLARHILLLQSWVKVYPGEFFCFSEVGWFLSTIMFLYLLNIPLRAVATRIKKNRRSSVIFAGIAAGMVIVIYIYSYLLRNTDMEYTINLFPVSRLGEYICGMSLGYLLYPLKNKLKEREDKKLAAQTAVWTLIEAAVLVVWWLWVYIPYEPWMFRIAHWLIPDILLLVVFTAGKGYISRLFRWKPLIYLGDISFEFYLIHSMVLKSYVLNTGGEATTTLMGTAFSLLLCGGVALLASALVSKVSFKNRIRPEGTSNEASH